MRNKHGVPVLPVPAKRKSKPVCRFNFQENKAMAFIAVQAYRSELRLNTLDEDKRNRVEAQAKAGGLW